MIDIEKVYKRPATQDEMLAEFQSLMDGLGIGFVWLSDVDRRTVDGKMDLEFKVR